MGLLLREETGRGGELFTHSSTPSYAFIVGFTLSYATKALRESRGTALLYF